MRDMANAKLFDIALSSKDILSFKEVVSKLRVEEISPYEIGALIHKSKELSADETDEMKKVFDVQSKNPTLFEQPISSKQKLSDYVKFNIIWLILITILATITKLLS
jgi:hypothetical protein